MLNFIQERDYGGKNMRLRKNLYKELEGRLGYAFKKKNLLDMALTHRSFRFENEEVNNDNQQLEFLGDAALSLTAADYLYRNMVNEREGVLTSFRSQMTSGKALTMLAKEINLGRYMKMGKGEERSGGGMRASNLEDALESILGAAYLDGGLKAVQKIFKHLFVPTFAGLKDVWEGNPKGKLQEYAQRRWKKSPQYRIISRSGPPHNTVFKVETVLANGVKGIGTGRSKQEAEAASAADVLSQLKEI